MNGQSYTILQNQNLATTNWMLCTNIIGDGSIYQFQAPADGNGQNFYRVSVP